MRELRDGRVLVTGGTVAGRYPNTKVVATAEIYDPDKGRFSPAGDMMVPRHKHAAVLLIDRQVLIIGGSDKRDWRGEFDSAEIHDPVTGSLTDVDRMHAARFKLPHSVVRMPGGRIACSTTLSLA
jgi:hypothetical protein